MQNPFESGHIKNYVLLYVSVVVIMVLFFIASTLFYEAAEVEEKVFDTNLSQIPLAKKEMQNIQEVNSSGVRLMEKFY